MQGLEFQRILNSAPKQSFIVYALKRDGGRVNVGTVTEGQDGKSGAHLAQRKGFTAVEIVL